jgi:hypothetical protein
MKSQRAIILEVLARIQAISLDEIESKKGYSYR